MKINNDTILYQQVFSRWAGCPVRPGDDFETFCDCNYDFIELLLVFEREFRLNLLESPLSRSDFNTVGDFLNCMAAQPGATESYIPFKWHQAEIIPIQL